MRATLTGSEDKFRQRITDFVDTAYPAAVRQSPTTLDIDRWFEAVSNKGWMTAEWPTGAGGTGWSPVELFLWYQELAIANCPSLDFFALQVVAPLLRRRGTTHQKEHLDAISQRVEIWGNATLDKSSVYISHLSGGDTNLHGTAPCIVTTPCDTKGPDWVLLLVGSGDKPLYLIDVQTAGINLSPMGVKNTKSSSRATCDTSMFRLDFDNVLLAGNALLAESATRQDTIDENQQNDQSLSSLIHLQTALIQLRQLIQAFALEEEFGTRLAEIDIQVHANCMTGLRHRLNKEGLSAHRMKAFILRGELIAHRLDSLLNDALGYYAIPALLPGPGANEPPLRLASHVHGGYARQLTSGQPVERQYDLIARNILGLPPLS